MSATLFREIAQQLVQNMQEEQASPALHNLLARLKIDHSQGIEQSLRRLAKQRSIRQRFADYLSWIVATAFPVQASLFLERALECRLGNLSWLDNQQAAARLVRLVGNAPFVGKMILGNENITRSVLTSGDMKQSFSLENLRRRLSERFDLVENHSDKDLSKRILRECKYEVLIGITDYILQYPERCSYALRALSNLATVITDAALMSSTAIMSANGLPKPLFTSYAGKKRSVPLTVIGVGKLGGQELNYSSDVDLIFLFLTDRGFSSHLTTREYYDKLIAQMIDLLGERTADGFCYRVDLRLRPRGRENRLALSLASMENYYQMSGMTWERLMLIKASVVCGGAKLGQSFLQLMLPFVYRRHIDYSMTTEIKEIKSEIDLQGQSKQRNIKEGFGGIREIEFIVQSLQITYGGRDSEIRNRNTIRALKSLQKKGYLKAADSEDLSKAYLLFRRIENALQMQDERQTYELPATTDDRGWRALSAAIGFEGFHSDEFYFAKFRKEVTDVRDRVHSLFIDLFHRGQRIYKPGTKMPDEVIANVSGPLQQTVDEMMQNLATAQSVSMRSRFRQLLVEVVELAEKTPDPVNALRFLSDFLRQVGHDASLLEQLASNKATLKYLLGLFGCSQDLSRFFLRHPELMDRLLVYGNFKLRDLRDRKVDAALTYLAGKQDFEAQLDGLRIYKNSEVVRVALNDLYGQFALDRVLEELSTLADACIHTAVSMAFQELGIEEVPLYLIIGLGKLGGYEIGYGSDLDLLFIVQDDKGLYRLEGGRKLNGFQLLVKIAQKLISILQLNTATGQLYKLDMRLRPSGNQGPLVTSLQAFRRYHEQQALIWERQTLLKARRIAGDPQLWRETRDFVQGVCFQRPQNQTLARQIVDMRFRLEKELARETSGKYNIKTGWGGLLDIEFGTQLLQLVHGVDHPSLYQANTLLALKELLKLGKVSHELFMNFSEAYNFYRLLENRIYLLTGRSEALLAENRQELDQLAKSIGMSDDSMESDGVALFRDYQQLRSQVRTHFKKAIQDFV